MMTVRINPGNHGGGDGEVNASVTPMDLAQGHSAIGHLLIAIQVPLAQKKKKPTVGAG
jgi:hypothetical protein